MPLPKTLLADLIAPHCRPPFILQSTLKSPCLLLSPRDWCDGNPLRLLFHVAARCVIGSRCQSNSYAGQSTHGHVHMSMRKKSDALACMQSYAFESHRCCCLCPQSTRALHAVSACLRSPVDVSAAQAAAGALYEVKLPPQLSAINGNLAGGTPPTGVSVGEAAREQKEIAPEPETQLGRKPLKVLPKAQAALPSPYQINADHVKRVRRTDGRRSKLACTPRMSLTVASHGACLFPS